MNDVCYLSPLGFEKDLKAELELHKVPIKAIHGERLIVTAGPLLELSWAQNRLDETEIVKFSSIKEAVTILRSKGRNWAHYSLSHHRRGELILENLPPLKKKNFDFLGEVKRAPMGQFSLLDESTLLFSPVTGHPCPLGEMQFNEDKINPPSRAYLKLWEAFTFHVKPPKKNSVCIDLGSCPGGWTWVLQTLGTKVISVDKAPLDEKIAKLPNIDYRGESAFSLKPENFPEVEWLFSDIICYPERLLGMVKQWMEKSRCKNYVCTIKFQGETNHQVVEEFKRIPYSKVIHLHHNKHELTWICQKT